MAIQVRTIGIGPGVSADLTDLVVGLRWSSINPGGDELASFQIKRQWFSGAPEIAQGNLLCISDGLSCLWYGRIGENDRAVSDSEMIGVTAYGLGVRLKDTVMTEVYVDRDPTAWTTMPSNRRAAIGAGSTVDLDYSFTTNAGGLLFQGVDAKAITVGNRTEAWYTAPTGVTIAKIQYIGAEANTTSVLAAAFFLIADDASGASTSAALTLDSTLRTATPATPTRYGFIHDQASATHTPAAGSGHSRRLTSIAAYGNHGLTTRSISAATPDGLYVEDIVANAVGRASGITIVRKDATSIILPHFAVKTPTTIEDVVSQANQYAAFDWGTFGPSSVLDTSTNGQFYYQARDTATAHWYARRSECDDISLQVEMASLYNQVQVLYTDPTTTGTQIVTRTATVQALNDAGLTRTTTINAGVTTPLGAQQLGDTFLALTSQQPPARGSIRLSGNAPTHYQRGRLPAHFMRADGSNIRVPDVLPSKDALSLSSAPDRRTTFPIKRVSVDCSGQMPIVSVDVDQTPDEMSALQARLGLAAQYPTAALPPGVTL